MKSQYLEFRFNAEDLDPWYYKINEDGLERINIELVTLWLWEVFREDVITTRSLKTRGEFIWRILTEAEVFLECI